MQSGIGGAIRQVRRNTDDLCADDVMELPAEPIGGPIEFHHLRWGLVGRAVACEATLIVDRPPAVRAAVGERFPRSVGERFGAPVFP